MQLYRVVPQTERESYKEAHRTLSHLLCDTYVIIQVYLDVQ